jgi:hypothetical protein
MKQDNATYFKLNGCFEIAHKRNGELIDKRVIDNLVTSSGKAAIAALILTDISSNDFDYIALGTGTTAAAAGNTSLESEITTGGGQRAAGSGTRITTSITNDTAQLVSSFSFTDSFAVTEAGMFNSDTGGDLLCRQVFSPVNVISGDTLQITWKIQVS